MIEKWKVEVSITCQHDSEISNHPAAKCNYWVKEDDMAKAAVKMLAHWEEKHPNG